MKTLQFAVLALALGSTTGMAGDCSGPQAPSLPDGATASMEDMLAGQNRGKSYTYCACAIVIWPKSRRHKILDSIIEYNCSYFPLSSSSDSDDEEDGAYGGFGEEEDGAYGGFGEVDDGYGDY